MKPTFTLHGEHLLDKYITCEHGKYKAVLENKGRSLILMKCFEERQDARDWVAANLWQVQYTKEQAKEMVRDHLEKLRGGDT